MGWCLDRVRQGLRAGIVKGGEVEGVDEIMADMIIFKFSLKIKEVLNSEKTERPRVL